MDSCCEVYLDNVELEESDIFGKEGNGFMRGVSDFNFERWLVGACDYGTAICSFEDAMKHANTRIAFGKPISRFQLNSLKITEMCIKLTNMRNMLYEPPGWPTTTAATSTRPWPPCASTTAPTPPSK